VFEVQGTSHKINKKVDGHYSSELINIDTQLGHGVAEDPDLKSEAFFAFVSGVSLGLCHARDVKKGAEIRWTGPAARTKALTPGERLSVIVGTRSDFFFCGYSLAATSSWRHR